MKKFRYRLKGLLRLRQQEEDQRKRKVGMLQTVIQEQQNRVLEMAAKLRKEGDSLRQQYQTGKVDLEWVSHYRCYVSQTQQAINRRIVEVTNIQKQLLAARRNLTEAAKKRRILEKLREKQKERFNSQLHRFERIEEDEISTRMYLHKLL